MSYLSGTLVCIGAETKKTVGEYGLAEQVLALRESGRHLVEDQKVLPAQVLYDAANKLAHDMLDAFPQGGATVGPALSVYKTKVPGFKQRADAINSQFKQFGVDVYSLSWKPVLDPWQDSMLSGDYDGAKDAVESNIGDAAKKVYDKFKDAAATAAWYTKATYWVAIGAGVLFVGMVGWGVASGLKHRIGTR